jgi:vancomycin permeability regulator SanA
MEDYQNLPAKVQEILLSHDDNKDLYAEAIRIQKKLSKVGYKCDFDLAGIIYDIKKITTWKTA